MYNNNNIIITYISNLHVCKNRMHTSVCTPPCTTFRITKLPSREGTFQNRKIYFWFFFSQT